YEPTDPYLYAFLAILTFFPGIAAVAYRATSRMISPRGAIPVRWILLTFWFASTAFLIILFGVPLVNYYYYFAPSLTLLASPAISSALKQIRSSSGGPLSRIIHARVPILFLGLLLAN